jgi:hypothetical protein
MKKYLITGAVCFLIGVVTTRYFVKANVETKIEKVEVVKTIENVKVVKETRPDGTVIETKETTVEKDKSTVAKSEKKNVAPRWNVSVSKDLLNDSQWSGSVSRSIFDNIYVAVTYRTNNVFGIGVTVTF